MSDILQVARNRILDENRKALPFVPKDLNSTWEKQAAWAGFVAGAWAGGAIGAHIGLAMGPLGAINGMIPGAIIGGIMGAFGAARAGATLDKPSQFIPQPTPSQSAKVLEEKRSVRDLPTLSPKKPVVFQNTAYCGYCKTR